MKIKDLKNLIDQDYDDLVFNTYNLLISRILNHLKSLDYKDVRWFLYGIDEYQLEIEIYESRYEDKTSSSLISEFIDNDVNLYFVMDLIDLFPSLEI
jgi:hypothetical protein